MIRRNVTQVLFAVMLTTFVMSGIVFAQGEVPPAIDWKQIIALAVNSVLVFFVVQLIKKYGPNLSSGAKQILALIAGPLLMMVAQPALSGFLGYPINFQPLVDAITGLVSSVAAMAWYDSLKLAGGPAATSTPVKK